MIDQPETKLFGNPLLQEFKFLVDELDDVAGFDVDQMVVMGFGRGLVTGTAIAELMPFEDAGLFEQADRPIDRRNRDVRVDRGGALMKRLDVGWSSLSDKTRAMVLRCSVIRRPLSGHSASMSIWRCMVLG